MNVQEFQDFSQYLIAIVFFSSNIVFWQKSNYFAPAAEENPMLHTWSLAVEEQFYIFFPIALLLLWRFGRNRIFILIAALSILSFLLCEYGARYHPRANFYLLPTRAWELGVGAICAFILIDKKRESSILSALGLGLILFAVFAYDESIPFPSAYTLTPVVGSVLIILFGAPSTFTAKILSARWLVGIGLISFSAYLWHQPLFAFARLGSINEPSAQLMAFLAIATILLAYLTWRYIERPFRVKTIPVLSSRSVIFAMAGTCSVVFASFGLYGHLAGGVSGRMSGDQFARWTEIRALATKRFEAIRAGECHFNPVSEVKRIDVFISNWDCDGSELGKPHMAGVAVFGDSHSADKAAAIRSMGYDIFQVGGAGCALLSEAYYKEVDYCIPLFDKVIAESESRGVQTIMLAHRFEGEELSADYIKRVVDFWGAHYENIFIFSPMPEFRRLDSIYAFYGPESVSKIVPDFSSYDAFNTSMDKLGKLPGVQVIDTVKLFCGEGGKANCAAIQNDNLMLVDAEHLSEYGMHVFGERLLAAYDGHAQILFKSAGK